jgi:hypothetical protein
MSVNPSKAWRLLASVYVGIIRLAQLAVIILFDPNPAAVTSTYLITRRFQTIDYR